MKVLRKLRQSFLLAISVSTLAIGQDQSPVAGDTVTANKTAVLPQDQVAQLKFDYAFGDQVAGLVNVPGATGKDWGIRMSLRALEDFLDKNPNALKGKTVLAAQADCSLMDYLFREKKLKRVLLEAVGKDGHIVLMGVSEKRTDGLGGKANKQIKEFCDAHPGVMIYGGAIIPPAAKGEKLASGRDYIYPQTAEEKAYIVKIAYEALNDALGPKAKTKTIPAAKPKN